MTQTDKERGELSVGGQNNRYNKITIDGVGINDPFGLEANNLATLKQPISIDSIQAVQVNVSNYDVTQKGYTGANINAVTKSGTNELKGSVYYVFRDDKWVGQRYNRSNDTYFDAPKFEEKTIGVTIGGPIIKDKLFFFATYEDQKSTRTAPTFGPIGDARPNVGITNSAIASAQAIASYRAKAADYAKQFGYAGYALREVNVSSDQPVGFVNAPMMRSKAMSASADEALPVEAGKGVVTVTVSGSVQMK